MGAKVDFDNVINSDVDSIIGFINNVSKKNVNSIDKIKEVIVRSNFSKKFEMLSVPDDKFLNNLVMCLIYSDIDPYLANTSIMEKYRAKVGLVCNALNLQVNNIVPVCEIEEKLLDSLVL